MRVSEDVESKEPRDIRAERFFKRAREEALRYGGDRWVFLRELVQNSRDAGASHILFSAISDGKTESITCRDNGSGMDRNEIEHYFLRLYASSKEDNADLLGYFGVGFWSVLLFEPTTIRVATRKGRETLGFEIDCTTGSIMYTDSDLDAPGTEVSLQRPIEGSTEDCSFDETIRERLIFYAGHIRPVSGTAALDLFLKGERLNRPFPEPPLCPKWFRTRSFDGVVGLGPNPAVRIYKGGILVSDLATLDEVIPSRKSRLPRTGWGMYPSVAINIDGLKLLLDRRRVFEDPLLHEAARFCEHELMKIHHRLIKRSLPLNLKNALLRFASRVTPKRAATATVFLILLVASVMTADYVSNRMNHSMWKSPSPGVATGERGSQSARRNDPIDLPLHAWIGAEKAAVPASTFLGDLSYESRDRFLFRLRTFPRFDQQNGFLPEAHRIVGDYPHLMQAGTERITVEIGISGGPKPFVLPVPEGHVLIKQSLRIGADRGHDIMMNTFQEPLLRFSHSGRLTYAVTKSDTVLVPRTFQEAPDIRWPDTVQVLLARIRESSIHRRVDAIRDFVAQTFAYTHTAPVRLLFEPRRLWIDDVLAEREGDCDVLNGLAVLLMRSAGVEAHLGVGVVGTNGGVLPGLHAWARYFDHGWRILDVTLNVPLSATSVVAKESSEDASVPTTSPSPSTAVPLAEDERDRRASSRTRRDSSGGFPMLAVWGGGIILLLGCGVAFLVRRRLIRENVEPEYIRDMFLHHFRDADRDGLDLEFRPVFRLLSGAVVSLVEVRRIASRHGLFGGYPKSPLVPSVPRNLPLLDRASESVRLLESLLPPVVWLDELPLNEDCPPLCAELESAERIIRELDPDFRIHQIPNSVIFQELTLRLDGPLSGVRHLLIGEKSEAYASIRQAYDANDVVGTFNAVEIILERTTFYGVERHAFLSRLARRFCRQIDSIHHFQEGQSGTTSGAEV